MGTYLLTEYICSICSAAGTNKIAADNQDFSDFDGTSQLDEAVAIV